MEKKTLKQEITTGLSHNCFNSGEKDQMAIGTQETNFHISGLEKLEMKASRVSAADSQFLFFSAYIIGKVFNTEEMSTCKVITHYGPDLPPLQINGAL